MVTGQPELETAVAVADVLQDMMTRAEATANAYRDDSIPEGALLDEVELQGQQVRWKKQKSMVRAGKIPLPERFEAFNHMGTRVMLPTAQMGRMLSKPRADFPDERAFHTHSRGMTRAACSICPPAKDPIEDTCEFCSERTGGKVLKVFFRESDAYAHKSRLHPDEFANLQRNIDRAERRAQVESQQRVAEAMLEMARQQTELAKHAAAAEAASAPAKR